MDSLVLLSDGNEAIAHREITVGVAHGGCPPGSLQQGVAASQLFSSVHKKTELVEFWKTNAETGRLTRENPFLNQASLETTDEQGLIPVGSIVPADAVLASILLVDNLFPKNKTSRGKQWVRDGSARVPPGWQGARVTSVARRTWRELGRGAPRGLAERIEISLRVERPLEVGDVLLVEDLPITVSGFAPDEQMPSDHQGAVADLVVSREQASRFGISAERFRRLPVGKGAERAADVLSARNVGPYSLISLRPLHKWPCGGQNITQRHVQWLQSHGFPALLGELVSFKSDDLSARPQLAALVDAPRGSLIDAQPAASESLLELRAWLITLGFEVTLADAGGHVTIALRPATPDEIRRAAPGQVRRPETLHYRTYEDVKEGLFCPDAFGPSEQSRRRRFAHFNLSAPIVPLLWRIGRPSLLERILQRPTEEIERLVKCHANLLCRQEELRLVERSKEGDRPNVEPGWDDLGTGAVALQRFWTRMPPSRLPAGWHDRLKALTPDVVVVTPPDLRPLVLLDNGNFATHDINDLFRRVINRSNRLRKLIELSAPQVILESEQRELQQEVDGLHANSLLPDEAACFGEESHHRLVCALASTLKALHVENKPLDWSGQARIVADESVSVRDAWIPHPVFDALRLNDSLPVLLTLPEGDGRIIARLPRPHADSVVRVSPAGLEELGAMDPAVCGIHRIVTTAGCEEARRLLEGAPSKRSLPAQSATRAAEHDWPQAATLQELAAGLVQAAIDGEPRALNSPGGFLLGGTGSVAIPDDGALRRPSTSRNPGRVEVPIPAESTPRSSPTADQISQIVQANRRPTCLFDVERTDQPPAAHEGRLGGQPYLPPDVAWPTSHQRPLPFLGQFPLDPAREAGILPIDVPPRSLLTVFWGHDWWQPGPCSLRFPIFIHSADGTSPISPGPEDWEYGPLCRITPRIVTEAPDWEEVKEILEWELESPDPKLLNGYRKQHWEQIDSASQAIKIGGWPGWVQSADSQLPLLLQINSNDEADLMFGDAGSLYVFVAADGALTCFSQCY